MARFRGAQALRASWRADPSGVGVDLLRLGMGLIWSLNLIFILAPANQYFPTFQSTAQSYHSQTLGGGAIPDFVAAHSAFFAWLIAVVTVYLAVAFLLGITTRLACIVGIGASVFFLLTQFLMTFMFPGGTDVGAHPLYILIYLVLFAARAGRYFAADALLWTGGVRFPRAARWLCAPPPVARPAAAARSSDTAAPLGPARRRRGFAFRSLLAVCAIAALLAVTAVEAMPPPPSGGSPSAALAYVVDIRYTLVYPGGAAQGAFGASRQDGCYICAVHVAPGSVTSEVVMLTNTQSRSSQTVDSMTVAAPFAVVSGPSLPVLVRPGQMWMFNLEIRTPPTSGEYTLAITFTVA